jgi:hypothetical protein
MSPLVVAILFALVCAGAFLVGLRFFRMAEPPGGATVEQVRRFGRLLMMASTAMLLFLAAIIVHGDLPLNGARALR